MHKFKVEIEIDYDGLIGEERPIPPCLNLTKMH
jgi:hypothetical protein